MAKGKNPEQGFDNPFFRDHEEGFVGDELTLKSPVGSVVNMGYAHEGPNAIETAISEQAPGKAKRNISKGAKK